jgi:sporulation protein YlmC with PRC-barrel domain
MKFEMDIPLNAEVVCVDGDCGHSLELIIDPKNDAVTHVVVKEKKTPHEERLVPVTSIVGTTSHVIRLQCTMEEFERFDIYCEKDVFVEPGNMQVFDTRGDEYVFPMKKVVVVEHKSVPKGELPLQRHASIIAVDGHVGRLDELMIDPDTDRITHLVLRESHLWGPREVTIPVSEIDRIDESEIYLKLTKEKIKDLPVIPIRR